jgi:hypothetical protein
VSLLEQGSSHGETAVRSSIAIAARQQTHLKCRANVPSNEFDHELFAWRDAPSMIDANCAAVPPREIDEESFLRTNDLPMDEKGLFA